MVKCSYDCIPCCDFCIYAVHEEFEDNGKMIRCGPVGCKKHPDKEHEDVAVGCGYCEDFHCFNAK